MIQLLLTVVLQSVFAMTPPLTENPYEIVSEPGRLGFIRDSILMSPIGLKEGVGDIDFPITVYLNNPDTANAAEEQKQVQQLFNQGMAYLHVYDYVEAYRSFNEALQFAEKTPMLYAGLAYSSKEIDSYYGVLRGARFLRTGNKFASDNKIEDYEKKWMQIIELALWEQNSDLCLSSGLKLVDAPWSEMKRLFSELVKDDSPIQLEALVWGSLLLWGNKTIEYSKKALAINPNHPGMNHYLIHYLENEEPEVALEHGRKTAEAAPNALHAQHMYGHVLPTFNHWDKAIEQLQRADDLHKQWMKDNNAEPSEHWHYGHNLDLLAAAYLGKGEIAKAKEAQKRRCGVRNRISTCWYYAEILFADRDVKGLNELLEEVYNEADVADDSRGQSIRMMLKVMGALLEKNINKAEKVIEDYNTSGGYIGEYSRIADSYIEIVKESQKGVVAGLVSRLVRDNKYYFNRSLGFDQWYAEMFSLYRSARLAKIYGINDLQEQVDEFLKKKEIQLPKAF